MVVPALHWRPTNGGEIHAAARPFAQNRWPTATTLSMPKPTAPPATPSPQLGISARKRPPLPRSDPLALPREKAYAIGLRFRPKRIGIAAFDWVAVWHGETGRQRRAFPLEAHGFEEALLGAAATILMETGRAIPQEEMELAAIKEQRVLAYLANLPRRLQPGR